MNQFYLFRVLVPRFAWPQRHDSLVGTLLLISVYYSIPYSFLGFLSRGRNDAAPSGLRPRHTLNHSSCMSLGTESVAGRFCWFWRCRESPQAPTLKTLSMKASHFTRRLHTKTPLRHFRARSRHRPSRTLPITTAAWLASSSINMTKRSKTTTRL